MSKLSDKIKKAISEQPPRTWKLRPEILLHPNIPKPMHGVAPREILGAKWWRATRKAAFESTDLHCVACGVHKSLAKYHQWLEGHELYEISYKKARMTYLETVPLCHYCHNYIHDGRLQALLDKGEIHHAKYVAIIQHGDSVLTTHGLRKPTLNERANLEVSRLKFLGHRAPSWGNWRLIIDGVEHPPKYKTYQQWSKAYS